MKPFVLSLTVTLPCLLAVGCGPKTNPPTSPTAVPAAGKDAPPSTSAKKDGAVTTRRPQPVDQAKPDGSLDAVALLKEFTANEDAAFKKYEGQLLVVEGEIKDAEQLVGNAGRMVQLYGPDRELRGEAIRAMFKPDSTTVGQTLGITVGRRAKIKGKFDRYSNYGVDLAGSEIVELGPDPAVAVSAEQLTQDFAKDAASAQNQYGDKQVLMEGSIAEIKPDAMPREIDLQGHDEKAASPPRVKVNPHADAHKVFPTMKVGQKVRIKGVCKGKEGNGVAVWNGVVIE